MTIQYAQPHSGAEQATLINVPWVVAPATVLAPQATRSLAERQPPASWTLENLCDWVDNALTAQRAPGRVTRGDWGATHVHLDFTPQAPSSAQQVIRALPALAAALGVSVTGAHIGNTVRLDIALATRKSGRHSAPLALPERPAPPMATEVIDLPVTIPTPAAPPVAAPLTRGNLLTMLYTAAGRELTTEPVTGLDLGVIAILTAQILGQPVQWADPLAKVGRFVQVAYQPIGQPDPELIVALTPGPAFQTAMRRFQAARAKAPTWGWPKWYRDVMAAARELVAPLQALQPTGAEALFVLRWAALAAATGDRAGRW